MDIETPPTTTARLGDLSRILWRQRELLTLLEYRLEIQQHVSVTGNLDHLHLALADVEAVLDDIRRSEDDRLGVVAECSVELGLDVGATLRELCAASPEPWNYVLAEHQTALLTAVAATEVLAAANREIASRGIGDTRRAFEHIESAGRDAAGLTGGASGPVTAYGRHGDRPALALPPTLVDRDA